MLEWWIVDGMIVDQLIQSPGIVRFPIARKRRSERHRERNVLGHSVCEEPREHSAKAPAQKDHRLPGLIGEISNPSLDRPNAFFSDLGIDRLAPAMRLKPGFGE